MADDQKDSKNQQTNISQPSNGDNFKMFFRVMSDNNGDDMLLDAAMDSYSSELSLLERRGQDILETIGDGAKRLFSKKKAAAPDYLNPTGAVPTTSAEQLEHQIKRKSSSAADAVFRPESPSVEKKSTFLKDVTYDVSVARFSAMKEITPTFQAGTVVDYFDKSVGLRCQNSTNGGHTVLKGEIEYEPFDNTVKISSSYNMPKSYIDGRVYLNKDNPGVSAGYTKQISDKACFRANASWFKSDAAFEVSYKAKLKDASYFSVGAYGSTYHNEIGVRMQWNFHGF